MHQFNSKLSKLLSYFLKINHNIKNSIFQIIIWSIFFILIQYYVLFIDKIFSTLLFEDEKKFTTKVLDIIIPPKEVLKLESYDNKQNNFIQNSQVEGILKFEQIL